jgi:hypothetical protein
MKHATKILILVSCISICAAGAALSLEQTAKDTCPKTKVVPVNNRARKDRIWIWS